MKPGYRDVVPNGQDATRGLRGDGKLLVLSTSSCLSGSRPADGDQPRTLRVCRWAVI